MRRTCKKILVALLAAVVFAAGCGSDDEDDTPMAEYKVLGGRLVWCAGTIESITVPDNASSIGNNAFKDCAYLTKVVIPPSVTKIGTGTFFGVAVTEIEYKGDMAAWETLLAESGIAAAGFPAKITVRCTDGIWKPKPADPGTGDDPKPDEPDDQDGWQIEDGVLVRYTGSAADVTIPKDLNVTAIGDGAFAGCTGITHVTIPDGVTSIGENAFDGCTSLTGIDIPGGVTNIGENAFKDCTSLADIDIPASVTGIGAGAIPAGTAVTYHGTAERWDELAENAGLDGVTVFIVDEGCTLTGYRGSAADITVPDGVTAVAGGALAGHAELEHIVIPAGVESIGSGAFGGTGITAIDYKGESAAWGEMVEASGIAGELAGITVTCADGSWTPDHRHDWSETYTNGGDGTHHRTCAGCGERSTAEEHAYGGTPQADGDSGHYQTCTAAGCEARSPTEAHGYTYTDNGDTHTMTCADCAHTKNEPHGYGDETSTSAGHGKTCAGCGHSETAQHTWSDTYTDGGTSGHYRTCTTAGCGAHSATVAHEFGGVTHTSAGGHYQLCTAAGCGARSPFEEHTYGGTPLADGDGGHYQTCTLAGCEARSPTEAHGYTYTDNGDTHTMTCPDCAHTKNEPHVYGDEMYTDDGHVKTCSRCGRSETAQHTWSNTYTDGGTSGHYQSCTTAGCNAHSASEAHTYGSYSDDNDGSHHSKTCSVCNRTERGTHTYGAYTSGTGGHYKNCKDCGARSATEPHQYAYTSGDANYHTETCSDCSDTKTEAHIFGMTYTDGGSGGHYQTCTLAGCGTHSASAAHQYGTTYTDDRNGSHHQTCSVCAATKTEAHIFGTSYTNGGTGGHYKTCAGCGAHSATEPHQYAYTSGDANYHTETCAACSDTKTEAHTFGMTYTDGGSGGHYQTCTLAGCGARSATEAHTWGSETCTTTGHSKTCSLCTYSATKSHSWSSYTDDGADTHSRTCAPDGFKAHSESAAHTYGSETYTDEGHVKTCSACSATKTEPHAYGTDYTSLNASNHRRTCTTAGCGRTETEAHTYAYTDNSNGTHTMDCTRCDYSRGSLHAYEGDACKDCGYPKPVLEGGTIDDTGTLTEYTGSAVAVEIPYGVVMIDSCAFEDCTGLASVTIPDSVMTINDRAFKGCTSLTTVTIPDSVSFIGYSAFMGCTNLTAVTIPDGVSNIYTGLFSGCTSLTSVTIPASVTLIRFDSFKDCTSLTSVTYKGTMAEWNAISKESSTGLTGKTIICTDGSLTQQ